MTLVSGNLARLWGYVRVPWRGGVKRQWGCPKRQFSVLSLTVSSATLELRPKLLYSIILFGPRRLSTDPVIIIDP